MSTEYRQGIPSNAHVEAATRLGLLWAAEGHAEIWRFVVQNDAIFSVFGRTLPYVQRTNPVTIFPNERTYAYRPIRPDGTPVDWEVLDAEVARVGRQGQPQGFRADLWRRICRHFTGREICNMVSFEQIVSLNDTACHFTEWYWDWCDMPTNAATQTDILARWTVYQELKPLYDLVDGAQGEAAMPRDVINQWWLPARNADRARQPIKRCTLIRSDTSPRYPQGRGPTCSWYADGADVLDVGLRNFAAVLDAVAEARVRARLGTVSPAQPGQQPIGRLIESTGDSPRTVAQPPALPEPRRFADVRPDRHGWRWWQVIGWTNGDIEIRLNEWRWHRGGAEWHPWGWGYTMDTWMSQTIIPTDEQGNPVSWEAAGFAAEAVRGAQESVQQAANDATPGRSVGDIEWTVPLTPDRLPLPRFTADELDDVDHSKTTKLDEVTLRRGKMPTVEQIAKYREVRARRTGGAVADALKESRIDCEVAQYVLERWMGGLGDSDATRLYQAVVSTQPRTQGEVDQAAQNFLLTHASALDTSEQPDSATQRERQESEARRQRLAELRLRLTAERLAQTDEVPAITSRFDLIEPDPQADPAASIRAWEARQAAAKVRPIPAPPHIAKPAAAPRRPAIEVVDAEVDGLSRSEAFAALFGRALNGGC